MRKPKFLLALAPCCLALMAISSSASPLASGLASKNATLPALNNGLLQKVQSWPCREKRKDMSADERRFCYRYYHRYYYYDYPVYESPAYGYGYPVYVRPAYPVYEYGYPAYGYPVYRHYYW
jgi:hypothetical protein